MSQDRRHLRATFDKEAALYDEIRPGYPEAMFEDIITYSGIVPDGRILEIGSGTGKATLPLARRGYHISCIEPGIHLAAIARQNLSFYPQIQWHISDFEQWPVEPAAFDVVLCATAFHWLDPQIAYPKIAQALKPVGTLALCWNIHVQNEASVKFFEAVQKVYQRVVPEWENRQPPWPYEVEETRRDEIVQTDLFTDITIRDYLWQETYSAENYIRLLNTFSDHIALDSATRQRLTDGIAEITNTEFGGSIIKGYLSRLYLARKKEVNRTTLQRKNPIVISCLLPYT